MHEQCVSQDKFKKQEEICEQAKQQKLQSCCDAKQNGSGCSDYFLQDANEGYVGFDVS